MSDKSLKIILPRCILKKSCDMIHIEMSDMMYEYSDISIDMENNDHDIMKLEKILSEKKRKRAELLKSEENIAINFSKKKRSIEALEAIGI